MPDEWFVVPTVTTTDADGNAHHEPAYLMETPGVVAYSGHHQYFRPNVHKTVPWKGSDMYVVRVYGTQETLDILAARGDVYSQSGHGISPADIAAYMNEIVGRQHSFAEWNEHVRAVPKGPG